MLMTSLEIAEALSEDVELYSSPAMLMGRWWMGWWYCTSEISYLIDSRAAILLRDRGSIATFCLLYCSSVKSI